jgi:hypothetical protein
MPRLEFPESSPEPVKKDVERLWHETYQADPPTSKPTSNRKLGFTQESSDPNKALADEVRRNYPHFSPSQLSFAAILIKQLTPLKEDVLTQFGTHAQDAQAEFIKNLAEHSKKLELSEVTELTRKAVDAASKTPGFLDKLLHKPVTDWSQYRALAQHLEEQIKTIRTSVDQMTDTLAQQKDRLPVHLAALSFVLDKQTSLSNDMNQLADSRRRALTFGVQQAQLLSNQVAQMKSIVQTTEENLSHFQRVTLPALEMKSTLE